MFNRLIDQDTRFWEVFNEAGDSIGIFMYYDLMMQFNNGHIGLNGALAWLKSINHTWKVIGDICPLEEDSENPIIQNKKIEYRKMEYERHKKLEKKSGYKLTSPMRFGKHSGKTIKEIIDKDRSYWNWMVKEKVLLLNPETKKYADEK